MRSAQAKASRARARVPALIAAAAVALIAAALGSRRCAPKTPPPPDPERFRVEYGPPSVDAALWFAARYPGYFTSGEDGLDAYLASLEDHERRFVLAMGQTLTWAWIEHELPRLNQSRDRGRSRDRSQDALSELAREVTRVVRLKTLNQLEVSLQGLDDLDDLGLEAFRGDARFEEGVFPRLVRGGTNCDGQNHFAALLLGAALDPRSSWIPGARADLAGIRVGHELVVVSGPRLAQPVYLDAWSNLPAFTLDPERTQAAPLLSSLGAAPPPVVPGLPARPPHPADYYAEATGVPIVLLPARDAPTLPVSLEIRAPALDEASLLKEPDPWRLYLFARILHLFDDPRAGEVYRHVLDRFCPQRTRPQTFVCAAAIPLHERATTPPEALPPWTERDRSRFPRLPGRRRPPGL